MRVVREERDLVRRDLVGRVAVRGDAVRRERGIVSLSTTARFFDATARPHNGSTQRGDSEEAARIVDSPVRAGNKQVHPLLAQQRADSRVAHHRVGRPETRQLDGRQARALLVRAGLREIGVLEPALLVKRGDDPEGGAVALRVDAWLVNCDGGALYAALTEVASEPVLQTCESAKSQFVCRQSRHAHACNNKRVSGGRSEAHREDRNLLAFLDRPLPLELLQDPLRAVVANLLAPLLVLDPDADSYVDDLSRERLGRRARGGGFCVGGRFDAREGFAEVDGGRAGSEEVSGSVEQELQEFGRRRGEG